MTHIEKQTVLDIIYTSSTVLFKILFIMFLTQPCVTNSVRIEFLTVSNQNVRNVTNTMLEILWDPNVSNIC
jgi:hypothetical protein